MAKTRINDPTTLALGVLGKVKPKRAGEKTYEWSKRVGVDRYAQRISQLQRDTILWRGTDRGRASQEELHGIQNFAFASSDKIDASRARAYATYDPAREGIAPAWLAYNREGA